MQAFEVEVWPDASIRSAGITSSACAAQANSQSIQSTAPLPSRCSPAARLAFSSIASIVRPVTGDIHVRYKPLKIRLINGNGRFGIKAGERGAERLSLSQHQDQRQAVLEALETELLRTVDVVGLASGRVCRVLVGTSNE